MEKEQIIELHRSIQNSTVLTEMWKKQIITEFQITNIYTRITMELIPYLTLDQLKTIYKELYRLMAEQEIYYVSIKLIRNSIIIN